MADREPGKVMTCTVYDLRSNVWSGGPSERQAENATGYFDAGLG